jgi:hypothetical protein
MHLASRSKGDNWAKVMRADRPEKTDLIRAAMERARSDP